MDYTIALDILEIDTNTKLTHDILKKKYHKMALLYHPDKNKNEDSTEKFKIINEAYQVLEEKLLNTEPVFDFKTFHNQNKNNIDYDYILNIFLESFFNTSYNKFIIQIIKEIINDYKNITLTLFEKINKELSFEIYQFLSKYKYILHISQETLNNVKNIILEKYSDNIIYILNPSIDDIFDCNIYKLEISNKIYYVPLWHNELYFDGSGCEIVVKCIPELPNNITIDENNNLIIDLKINFTYNILTEKKITVKIGKNNFDINTNELKLQKFQKYIFYKKGISDINEYDIYNNNNKSDIIINITFIE